MKNFDIQVKTQKRGEDIEYWHPLDIGDDTTLTLDYVNNIFNGGIDKISCSKTFTIKLPRTANNDAVLDMPTVPSHDSRNTYKYVDCRIYVNGIDIAGEAKLYILDSESDNIQCCAIFGVMQNYKGWIDSGKTLRDLTDSGEHIKWNWRAAFIFSISQGSPHDILQYPPIWYSSSASASGYNPTARTQWYAFKASDNSLFYLKSLPPTVGTYVYEAPEEITTKTVGSVTGGTMITVSGKNFVRYQDGDVLFGSAMNFGIYNCGFTRDDVTVDYANIHPFVTLREIWQRIINENNLDFNVPSEVLLDMKEKAVVLTKIDGNPPVGEIGEDASSMTSSKGFTTLRLSTSLTFGWIIPFDNIGECYRKGGFLQKDQILYKGSRNIGLRIKVSATDSSSFSYGGENHTVSYILDAVGHLDYLNMVVSFPSIGNTVTVTPTVVANVITWNANISVPLLSPNEGDVIAELYIDNNINMLQYLDGAFERYWFNHEDWNNLFQISLTSAVVVSYSTSDGIYPNDTFKMIKNLPEIKQIDFVKAICNLYGLFVMKNSVDDSIDFVKVSALIANESLAYDWSDRLVDAGDEVPEKISFRFGDLAQKNKICYKTDENDDVTQSLKEAYLRCDDVTLEYEKDFFELPFAATEDDTIKQYNLIEPEEIGDDYTVERNECDYRLMNVKEWEGVDNSKVTILDFNNLNASNIALSTYADYQTLIRKPILITEHVRAVETELERLDMTKPVYLAKYGRYFAIKDLKWNTKDDFYEVQLLLI